jgi:DNA-binding transcriptional LysR family regulator
LDINSFVVFFKVAETNSLTKAAVILEMPVSTVSRKLQKLEEDLGNKLFHRTTRKISLTQEGSLLYEKAKPHFDELESIGNELTGNTLEVKGEIRITAPLEKYDYLTEKLTLFRKSHPHINLHVNFSNDFQDLVQGSFDFAFRAGVLSDSNMFYYILGEEKLCAYVHKNFTPYQITFDTLNEYDYLVMEKNTFLETLDGRVFKPDNKITSNSVEFMLKVAKTVPSIIYVPEKTVNEDYIKLNIFKEKKASFQIVYLSKQQNKICKLFLDFFKENG